MNFSSLGDHSIQAREPEQWLSRGQEDQPRTQLGSLMLGRGPQLGWPAVGFKLSCSELKLCWSKIETSGFSKIPQPTWQHKPAVPWYSHRPQGGLRGCWQRRCSRRRCCQRRRQGGRRRIWKPSLWNINWRICRHQLLSQALVLELDLCDKGHLPYLLKGIEMPQRNLFLSKSADYLYTTPTSLYGSTISKTWVSRSGPMASSPLWLPLTSPSKPREDLSHSKAATHCHTLPYIAIHCEDPSHSMAHEQPLENDFAREARAVVLWPELRGKKRSDNQLISKRWPVTSNWSLVKQCTMCT